MITMKKGPKGGSYYISKKGKKVYTKSPPAKKDPSTKLGLSPDESKILVDLKKSKKAKTKEKAKEKPKEKPRPKEEDLVANHKKEISTLEAKADSIDAKLTHAKGSEEVRLQKELDSLDAKIDSMKRAGPTKKKPSTKDSGPKSEKPKEPPKKTEAKKDTRRYLSGDDASPAEIKKMEKVENRNFEKLSKSEQNAVKAYTGDDYEQINKKLRGGDPPTGHAIEMDKALAKSSLSQDMEVHRGFTLEGRPPPEIGSVMQDNAYMSTSHGQRRAEGFISRTDESVMMKVKVPKGSKAIYVGGNSKYGNEQELLLDRGAQVKFTSRKKVGNVWHYEAELVSTNQSRL